MQEMGFMLPMQGGGDRAHGEPKQEIAVGWPPPPCRREDETEHCEGGEGKAKHRLAREIVYGFRITVHHEHPDRREKPGRKQFSFPNEHLPDATEESLGLRKRQHPERQRRCGRCRAERDPFSPMEWGQRASPNRRRPRQQRGAHHDRRDRPCAGVCVVRNPSAAPANAQPPNPPRWRARQQRWTATATVSGSRLTRVPNRLRRAGNSETATSPDARRRDPAGARLW